MIAFLVAVFGLGCGVDPTPPGGDGSACETDEVAGDVVHAQYVRALCARWEECGWSEPVPCLEAMNDGSTCPDPCDCEAAEACYEEIQSLGCGEFADGTPDPCGDGPIGTCFATCG